MVWRRLISVLKAGSIPVRPTISPRVRREIEMRKLAVAALAILALALTGATTKEGYPACGDTEKGVELYEAFVQAIVRQDGFVVQYYMNEGLCGPMFGGMEVVEVLERGDHWIKVRIQPPTGDKVELYMSKDAITE